MYQERSHRRTPYSCRQQRVCEPPRAVTRNPPLRARSIDPTLKTERLGLGTCRCILLAEVLLGPLVRHGPEASSSATLSPRGSKMVHRSVGRPTPDAGDRRGRGAPPERRNWPLPRRVSAPTLQTCLTNCIQQRPSVCYRQDGKLTMEIPAYGSVSQPKFPVDNECY